MYVLLVLLMMSSLLCGAKVKPSKKVPGTAIFVTAHQPDVFLKSKKLQTKNNNINLEITIPQFEGLTDGDFQKLLNSRLYRDAKNRKKEIIKLAADYNKELSKDEVPFVKFEYIENFTIIDTIAPYFVVECFQYQYNGGAHGLSELSYIVLDTVKNEVVQLQDLFREDVDYCSILNKEIDYIIKERVQKGEFFFQGSDGFQSIKENQPFFINYEGDLVIVFNVYEIAPYAAGPQYIVIPREKLLPYLK